MSRFSTRLSFVIAAIAFGGVALAGCTGPPAAGLAPTTVTRTETATPPATTSTAPGRPAGTTKPATAEKVLNLNGFGKFTLRMSRQAALAVGGLTEDGSDVTCTAYAVASGGRVVISAKNGVVIIEAPAGAHTPEGIRVGSTVRQVKAVYPEALEYRNGFTYKSYDLTSNAPGNPYRDTDTIDRIRVQSNASDCSLALH